jgi:hypothetical protein
VSERAPRIDSAFGKQPWELALMLGLNRGGKRPAGAIDFDATHPLNDVVDELLRLTDSEHT